MTPQTSRRWRARVDSLERLAQIGMTDEGACCHLALTDEDRAGRDLVSGWMRDCGLQVHIDPIGNIFGVRPGRENLAAVMTGSHVIPSAPGAL